MKYNELKVFYWRWRML